MTRTPVMNVSRFAVYRTIPWVNKQHKWSCFVFCFWMIIVFVFHDTRAHTHIRFIRWHSRRTKATDSLEFENACGQGTLCVWVCVCMRSLNSLSSKCSQWKQNGLCNAGWFRGIKCVALILTHNWAIRLNVRPKKKAQSCYRLVLMKLVFSKIKKKKQISLTARLW